MEPIIYNNVIIDKLDYFLSSVDIRLHANEIDELFKSAQFIQNDYMYWSNKIKSKIQKEAEQAWLNRGCWSSQYMATGSGKSKIAVNITGRGFNKVGEELRGLIVVPTQKLRDTGWKREFHKWNGDIIYKTCIRTICYDSLHTIKNEHFHFVVLDEGHNITEDSADFFMKEWGNTVDKVLLLSATRPTDILKKRILKNLNLLEPSYELDLNTAVKLHIVADYEINIVTMDMTEEERKIYYKMSNGKAKFNMFNLMNRMHFIYQLDSKKELAKKLLDNVVPKDSRVLIFCGSKEQANYINSGATYYSKPTKPKRLDPDKKYTPKKKAKYEEELKEYYRDINFYMGTDALHKFELFEINWLACVRALNEGHNIDNIDYAFVIQLNSKELHFIQRIGRILRMRANHVGKIIILAVRDTVDMDWCMKATANINPTKIKIISIEDLRTNKVKLF